MKLKIGDNTVKIHRNGLKIAFLGTLLLALVSSGIWVAWYKWYPLSNEEIDRWFYPAYSMDACRFCGARIDADRGAFYMIVNDHVYHVTGHSYWTNRTLAIHFSHKYWHCKACNATWLTRLTDEEVASRLKHDE